MTKPDPKAAPGGADSDGNRTDRPDPAPSESRRDDSGRPRRETPRLTTEVPYTSPFTVVGRMRSFRHAAKGIGLVLRSQHNAWLHAVATVLALVLAAALHLRVEPLTTGEWADLVLAIVLVWVAETFNTGLEVLADGIEPERHPVVKIAKDIAAAAVLMAALGALVVGAVLFVPRLLTLLESLGAAS